MMEELKPLSPTEYLRSFGAMDNEGEWQGIDTSQSHPFGLLTLSGQKRQKLRAIQGGMMEGYQDYIKKFNAAHIKQLMAPPAEVANKAYGVPLDQSQMMKGPDVVDPSFQGPMPPVPLPINDLIGDSAFRPAPAAMNQMIAERSPELFAEAPRPMISTQIADPNAKLLPWQVEMMDPLQKAEGVMDESGRFMPTSLANTKLHPDNAGITGEEANTIMRDMQTSARKAGVPDDKIPEFTPYSPTARVNRSLLSSRVKETNDYLQTHLANKQKQREITQTAGVVTLGLTGKNASDITNEEWQAPPSLTVLQNAKHMGATVHASDTLATLVGRYASQELPTALAGTKAAAQTVATQATSLVPPEKQSNYIHMDTYANSGKVVYPTSTPDEPFTLAKAATGGWKEITDKQKEAIKTIEIARSTQSTLLDLAHQLIKAQGPGSAFVQGMKTKFGAFIRSNPVAAAFVGDKEAFSGWMARMVEVGVLTQQDIGRWASVLPDERDTVGSAVEKEAVLNMLFDAAELANRRAIVGDRKGLESAKKSLQEQIEAASKLYGKGRKTSAQDLFKEHFGEN